MNGVAPTSSSQLAPRLRGAVVSLRVELQVSRHVFRGEPCYVVRDPITFLTHSLTPDDYELFVSLDGQRTLHEIFNSHVEAGRLQETDEEAFCGFIVELHRAGLLTLPISDDKALYERFERRRRAGRKGQLLGFLFLRVPLCNPDTFLNRTIHLARPLFTRWFFAIWLVMVSACAVIVGYRFDELTSPLLSLFQAHNLLTMWLSLVGLKIIHEFGHAYACKSFGGAVPEMGAYFIVFTPYAYVDATASWGFPSTRQRLIVSLGGMYFESMVAAGALIVWAATSASMVNTLAYQTFLLASIVTIGFNVNPLMRYDGYYILSDLVGVPNLRAKASQQLLATFDRFALGIRHAPVAVSRTTRTLLATFGVAAFIYKTMLVFSLCAVIALKAYVLGLALAAFYLATTLIGIGLRAAKHLFWDPQTSPVRRRAVFVGACMFVGLPAALCFVPVPGQHSADGVIAREHESIVRAAVPGELAALVVREGQRVLQGQHLATIDNPILAAELEQTQAELTLMELESRRDAGTEPAEYSTGMVRLAAHREQAKYLEEQIADQQVLAPVGGTVLQARKDSVSGQYVLEGEPICTVGSGPWVARFFLNAAAVTEIDPQVGDPVQCRALMDPTRTLSGSIISMAPVGSRLVDEQTLTHFAGGHIVVDPQSGQADRPYFMITVRIDENSSPGLARGTTVRAEFADPSYPIAHRLRRTVINFLDRLKTR